MAGRSPMNREVHVGFCESLGVKFPRATRRVPRSRAEDEGRPFGAGLQEQASNHLKLLWSKAMVVSVGEKSRHKTAAGETQRDERKRTIR